MKKAVIFALVVLLTGCASRTMTRVIDSWQGQPLETVIKAWGYPTSEKYIADHHLYLWEEYNGAETRGGFWPGAQKWGGRSLEHKYCNRILEVDQARQVIGGQWQGNDCPKLFTSWTRAIK